MYRQLICEVTGQESDEGGEMESIRYSRKTLVVARQATDATQPSEAVFNGPPFREQDEALAGIASLDDDKLDALWVRKGRRVFAALVCIGIKQFRRVDSVLLDALSQHVHFTALGKVGRSEREGQHRARYVGHRLLLGAAKVFLSIRNCSLSALYRPRCATIRNRWACLWLASSGRVVPQTQIRDDIVLAAGDDPTAWWLVNYFPGRQVSGQSSPRHAGPDQIANDVEDLRQLITSLRGSLQQQTEVRRDEGTFLIADIAEIGTPDHVPILYVQLS